MSIKGGGAKGTLAAFHVRSAAPHSAAPCSALPANLKQANSLLRYNTFFLFIWTVAQNCSS